MVFYLFSTVVSNYINISDTRMWHNKLPSLQFVPVYPAAHLVLSAFMVLLWVILVRMLTWILAANNAVYVVPWHHGGMISWMSAARLVVDIASKTYRLHSWVPRIPWGSYMCNCRVYPYTRHRSDTDHCNTCRDLKMKRRNRIYYSPEDIDHFSYNFD